VHRCFEMESRCLPLLLCGPGQAARRRRRGRGRGKGKGMGLVVAVHCRSPWSLPSRHLPHLVPSQYPVGPVPLLVEMLPRVGLKPVPVPVRPPL